MIDICLMTNDDVQLEQHLEDALANSLPRRCGTWVPIGDVIPRALELLFLGVIDE